MTIADAKNNVSQLKNFTENIKDVIDLSIINNLESSLIPQSFLGQLGIKEQNVYSFEISEPSNFDLHIYGLTRNAGVLLLNEQQDILSRFRTENKANQSINTKLEPGEYHVVVASGKNNNTAYQLTFSTLEESNFKNSSLTEYVVPVRATDINLNKWLEPHYVAIDESVVSQNKLLVFLPGSNGKSLNQQLIIQQAAQLGYHAINLQYATSHFPANSVGKLCRNSNSTDLNCHGQVRREIIYGDDASQLVDVDKANSIEGRLVKLLEYLDEQNPTQGWSQYLNGDTPLWESITVAGHSQGGGHAAFIAKNNSVDRAILFGAPADYHSHFDAPAFWLTQNSATPTDRYYGFVHQQDRGLRKIGDSWDLLGLSNHGEPVNVDEQKDYGGSHVLFTNGTPRVLGKEHGSVVRDSVTPLLPDGTPLYADVWEYLLTSAPVESEDVEDSYFTIDETHEEITRSGVSVFEESTETEFTSEALLPTHFEGEVIDLTDFAGKQIRAEFRVEGNAQYHNLGGLYLLSDDQGTVSDPLTGELIAPHQEGYAQAALRNTVVELDSHGSEVHIIPGGFHLGVYLLADGETPYFSFEEANLDGLDHTRLTNGQTFGFEDLLGGGDRSYDDFIVEVDLLF